MRDFIVPKFWFLIVLILAVFVLYAPGLTGDFLLDDYHTLEPLGWYGGIDSLDRFWSYVINGTAGPVGRPLSMFSFVMNAQNWPADAFSFLLTNVIIHCSNTLLVFLVAYYLVGVSVEEKSTKWVALLVAMVWALHPIQVSSVLYIVQRMATLSALFSFLALVVYLHLRLKSNQSSELSLFWKAALVLVLSVCALLSKETGALIPLYLLIIELYLRYSGVNPSKKMHVLVWYAILIGSALVVLYWLFYLFSHVLGFNTYGKAREFSMYERVLTQSRVLAYYLYDILIPKMQTAGVYHDGFPISKSVFNPISTLFFTVMHLSLLGGAWLYRKKVPIVFLGVFWFYSSHLIESTIIMLELKFEHRNYIGIAPLALMAGILLYKISISFRLKLLASMGIVVTYGGLLLASTSLWGDPLRAALVWMEENPTSPRAIENAASKNMAYGGELDSTKRLMKKLVSVRPTATSEIKYVLAFCETYDQGAPDWGGYAERIESDPRNWSLHKVIIDLISQRISEECMLPGYQDLLGLVNAYRANPVYKGQLTGVVLTEHEFKLALYFQDTEKVRAIELAQDLTVTPLAADVYRAGLLATYGYLDFAEERLANALEVKRSLGYPRDSHMAEAVSVLKSISDSKDERSRESENE